MVRRGVASTLILAAADQITKWLAANWLRQGSIALLPGVFELTYVENRGAAFGVLRDCQWLFIVFALAVLAAGVWVYPRIKPGRRYLPMRICCCLLCAGALGNLIDRIRLHYVIDFLYVSLIDFPVFNVADIYVTVGCAIVILCVLFIYREEEILC